MPAICLQALTATSNTMETMAEVEIGKRLELLEIADAQNARGTAKGLGAFLNSAERQARLSRKDRLRIVEQALLLMEMNYVHLPMKRAIHADRSDPAAQAPPVPARRVE